MFLFFKSISIMKLFYALELPGEKGVATVI